MNNITFETFLLIRIFLNLLTSSLSSELFITSFILHDGTEKPPIKFNGISYLENNDIELSNDSKTAVINQKIINSTIITFYKIIF